MDHAQEADGQGQEALTGLGQAVEGAFGLLVRFGHVDDDLEVSDLVLCAQHLDQGIAVGQGRGFGGDDHDPLLGHGRKRQHRGADAGPQVQEQEIVLPEQRIELAQQEGPHIFVQFHQFGNAGGGGQEDKAFLGQRYDDILSRCVAQMRNCVPRGDLTR